MAKRTTVYDVARRARVSPATVSRTIHSPDIVRPETRNVVTQAIRDLGFTPNSVARSLASRRTRIVAALVPSISNAIVSQTVGGLTRVLEAEQYQLLLGNTERSGDREAEAALALIGRQPDGIAVIGELSSPEALEVLAELQIPIVQALGLPRETIDIAVGYSNRNGARDMTRALAGAGYDPIAFVGTVPGSSYYADERANGFRAAMREAGKHGQITLELPWPGDYAQGAAAIKKLLDSPQRPRAAFFASDILALGAMLHCLNAGIRIPDEIGIVGFGGQELGRLLPPGLTTVQIDGDELGVRAARSLLKRMADRTDVPRIEDVGYKIVQRGSALLRLPA